MEVSVEANYMTDVQFNMYSCISYICVFNTHDHIANARGLHLYHHKVYAIAPVWQRTVIHCSTKRYDVTCMYSKRME